MTLVDWTLVGRPHWHLTLHETEHGQHYAVDQYGRHLTLPHNALATVGFMRSFAAKHENVTLDEAAISRALDKSAVRWAEAQAATLPLAPVIPLRKDVA